MKADAAALSVAYLVDDFDHPMRTHVRKEAEALVAAGATIVALSLEGSKTQRAQPPRGLQTFSVGGGLVVACAAHLRLIATGRRLWWRGMVAALSSRPAGPKGVIRRLRVLPAASLTGARLRKAGVSHLHVHATDAAADVGMIAAAFAGLPYSLSVEGPDDFFSATAERLDVKISRAEFVACAGHFVRGQCMIWAKPEDWGKLHVIHSGAVPAPASAAQDKGSLLAISVTPLTEQSGAFDLIDAFAMVHQRLPDARLALIGDGPAAADIQNRLAQLNLTAAVEMIGWLEEASVEKRLSFADLYVSAGGGASQPTMVKRAMAHGLPVVVARAPGVLELIQDGATGLITRPGRPADLAAAVVRLASDPKLRVTIGKAALDLVAADHDAALEAERLAELFAASRRPSVTEPGGAPDAPAIPPDRRAEAH